MPIIMQSVRQPQIFDTDVMVILHVQWLNTSVHKGVALLHLLVPSVAAIDLRNLPCLSPACA